MQVEESEMTPHRVKEIYETRGFQAAAQCAAATQDEALVRLVKFLRKQEESRPRHPGATAKARASGKLARRAENRAVRDAECRARKGASSGGQSKKK
jgi:hypothetical protein